MQLFDFGLMFLKLQININKEKSVILSHSPLFSVCLQKLHPTDVKNLWNVLRNISALRGHQQK